MVVFFIIERRGEGDEKHRRSIILIENSFFLAKKKHPGESIY